MKDNSQNFVHFKSLYSRYYIIQSELVLESNITELDFGVYKNLFQIYNCKVSLCLHITDKMTLYPIKMAIIINLQ